MAKTLDVYLHSDLVGHLVQDPGGRMVFDYAESWLSKPGATPLSQSLPLRTRRFDRNECRGYFVGILPGSSPGRFLSGTGHGVRTQVSKEGVPWLKQCFGLLRAVSSTPVIDLMRLLEAVIYNYLVGNNDAHGKNLSLLYHGIGTENPEIRLAPLYDIVSTVYYPELSPDMAMKIGGEYSSEKLTARNFEQLAEEAGLGKPLARARVPEMAERVIAGLGKVEIKHPDAAKVAALIRQRSEKIGDGFRKMNAL